MTVDLTAYICCTKAGGIEVEPPPDSGAITGISVSDTEIEAKIVPNDLPPGCDTGLNGKITAYMHTTGGYIWTCQNSGDGYLGIQYPVDLLFDYPEIMAKNHEHCQWIETQIAADGPERCNHLPWGCLWVYTHVNSGPGTIPEDKDDVFPNGGGENTHQVTDNFFVPGMRIRLEHLFYNYYDVFQITTTYDYYQTPMMTGGQIVVINGQYGDKDITYDVSIPPTGSTKGEQREVITCRPSDWIKWALGDWVFVLRGGNPPIIVPFKIGEDGA